MGAAREAVIVGAVRTPIGRRNGSLSGVHPVDLLAGILGELMERTGADPGRVEDHITGCVSQIGEQSINIGRNAWLAAGFPEEIPGTTIDRQCGSSQQAVHFAAQGVLAGAYDLVVASGVESMTRVPMGSSMAGQVPWGERLLARYEGKLVPQGISADLIATKWDLSREACDDFGFRSHVRAGTATREGRFRREIAPLKVAVDGGERLLDVDEGIRMEPDRDRMRDLAPAFEAPVWEEMFPGELHWTVTAGNSSQISDGAAAVLLADASRARGLGLRPRARILAQCLIGAEPYYHLDGPVAATERVLTQAGMTIGDIDLFEINEAFASVVLSWQRVHRPDPERVNVNGGAIALGHAVGSTGARLLTTTLHELERRDASTALISMCAGGAMSTATIIERI
jgi:acetyl-CoA acyltransferase